MKILFAGTPANAARTLEALLAGPHEVVAVLTRPDAPVGRKRVLTPSATAEVAQRAGIPVFKANSVTPELAEQLRETGAELGVIVAYGALLKRFALDAMPLGWLNLHYSLLPDWRGAAPVQNAILAGDSETGVTLFQLDEGMDTGPILDSVATQIQPGETSGRLLARLTELGITLLDQALPLVASGIARFKTQPIDGNQRVASKLGREQGRINWLATAREIENRVLAMNPEPMAHATLGEENFRILDARVVQHSSGAAETNGDEAGAGEPGTLIYQPKRVLVACGSGTFLELLQVQPAGKNAMSAVDWARGAAGKVSRLG
ncbi:MAG: methionyl-tRNA formyltransferase [Micrococcales bacterium]